MPPILAISETYWPPRPTVTPSTPTNYGLVDVRELITQHILNYEKKYTYCSIHRSIVQLYRNITERALFMRTARRIGDSGESTSSTVKPNVELYQRFPLPD